MMNRSAKDGARSRRQYGGEGVLTHPSHQGVCERHDTEDLDVGRDPRRARQPHRKVSCATTLRRTAGYGPVRPVGGGRGA